MKLNVLFSEMDESFNTNLSEDNQAFNADVGEVMVLHDGQNGATFIPYVSPDGFISWTNDRDLPNPVPVNIKGEQGEQGLQGVPGIQGIQGVKGDPGKDGYTPIKGTDYFTEADKTEMVSAVIAALPVYDGSVTGV